MRGHSTLIRPYPVSVEWPPEAAKHAAPVETCRETVRQRFALPSDAVLGVGVERLDFTKGIADRFHAVARFLEKHPEWIGRFVFLQVAAPSRGRLPAYRLVQEETVAAAEEVNARFGNDGYKPIHLVMRHHDPHQVYEIYRAADLCVVSSLHDGMNLVAKEFVASREDGRGVLILSTFAGASRELPEALTVNPYDTEAMADAIHDAVRMPPDQQMERMALMRASVRENNVYFWAGRMLLDAALLRRRSHIEGDIAKLHRMRGGDRRTLLNLQGPAVGN